MSINSMKKHQDWFFEKMTWLLALCIILPILFLIFLEFTRTLYLDNIMTLFEERILVILIMVIGVVAFSNFVFYIIRNLRATSEKQRRQFQTLNEIGFELASEHQLEDILTSVLKSACQIVDARLGALLMTDKEGNSTNFIEWHLDEFRYNSPPEELSPVLNHILVDGRTFIANAFKHNDEKPSLHDTDFSIDKLIAVPIISRSIVFGVLYLVRDNNEINFNQQDLNVLTLLASHTAVAIDNAQLYQRLGKLSVLEERQRIAMDLHDGAIQSLYALGLQLESLTQKAKSTDTETGHIIIDGAIDKVDCAVININGVIKELREYIFHLNLKNKSSNTLSEVFKEETNRLQANGIQQVFLEISRPLSTEQDTQLYCIERIIHESVSNIIKHSQASSVHFKVDSDATHDVIYIQDNGIGCDNLDTDNKNGLGIQYIKKRLKKLQGNIEITSQNKAGFTLKITVLKQCNAHNT